MFLLRNYSGAVGESFLSFTDIGDYIKIIVNIYSAAELDKKYWLTDRETDFFICLSRHVLSGIENPISDPAVQIYKKYFNPRVNKKDISHYLNRICKKKWAVYNVETKIVQIVPILVGIDIDEDRFDFKIRLVMEQREK